MRAIQSCPKSIKFYKNSEKWWENLPDLTTRCKSKIHVKIFNKFNNFFNQFKIVRKPEKGIKITTTEVRIGKFKVN